MEAADVLADVQQNPARLGVFGQELHPYYVNLAFGSARLIARYAR
jgi:hypothetical protein